MRILVPGVLPENKVYELHCHNCGCKFQAEGKEGIAVADIYEGSHWQMQLQRTQRGYKFVCPMCEDRVLVARGPS